jgi:hypothetical protein
MCGISPRSTWRDTIYNDVTLTGENEVSLHNASKHLVLLAKARDGIMTLKGQLVGKSRRLGFQYVHYIILKIRLRYAAHMQYVYSFTYCNVSSSSSPVTVAERSEA